MDKNDRRAVEQLAESQGRSLSMSDEQVEAVIKRERTMSKGDERGIYERIFTPEGISDEEALAYGLRLRHDHEVHSAPCSHRIRPPAYRRPWTLVFYGLRDHHIRALNPSGSAKPAAA
jgi:hypothetical protein